MFAIRRIRTAVDYVLRCFRKVQLTGTGDSGTHVGL